MWIYYDAPHSKINKFCWIYPIIYKIACKLPQRGFKLIQHGYLEWTYVNCISKDRIVHSCTHICNRSEINVFIWSKHCIKYRSVSSLLIVQPFLKKIKPLQNKYRTVKLFRTSILNYILHVIQILNSLVSTYFDNVSA